MGSASKFAMFLSAAVVPRAVRCLVASRPLQWRQWRQLRSLRMTDESLTGPGATKMPVVDPMRPRPGLRECISQAPSSAGVYIMEGADGRKLYIGKSVKLSSRVPSYFNVSAPNSDRSVLPAGNLSHRIAVMTTLVERIEYIATVSGGEALVLEASLIRQHQPPFNVLLKDDKQNYPYVCFTWSEPYPRLIITRDKPRRGGGPEDRYYGPFVDVGQLKSTVALVRRVLPLRSRAQPLYKDKPCLNYDVGLCPGPCQRLISEEDYAKNVRLAEMVFQGEGGELLSRLQERMETESRAERFERAGEIKAQIALVQGGLLGSALHFSSRGVAAGGSGGGLQSGPFASELGGLRRDVVAVGLAEGTACFQVFKVRGGRLTARLGFTYQVEGDGLPRGEVLQACLERYWRDLLKPGSETGGGKAQNLAGLSLSPSSEGGGCRGARGEGSVADLDIPQEIVTADALPAGGAALLEELLSGARKEALDVRQRQGALSEGERVSNGAVKEIARGEILRGSRKAGKMQPPAVDVRVVYGVSGTGERHHLCVTALKNAELEAERLLRGSKAPELGLVHLTRMLGLSASPARIEGYDVSHTGGGQAVASMVCFVDGKVSPKDHRRYKIRSRAVRKGHSDDYASLKEVIARRFSPPSHPLASAKTARIVPDLVLIDGGMGQLAAALEGAAIAAREWESTESNVAPLADDLESDRATVLCGTAPLADSSSETASSVAALPIPETAQDDPCAVLLPAAPAVKPLKGGVNDAAGVHSVDVGGGWRVMFVSLAKKDEEVFLPGASEPLPAALEVGLTSPGLMILRQVRDEAHRFALAYHRKLRGDSVFLPGRNAGAREDSEIDSTDGNGGRQRGFEDIAGLSSKARDELSEIFGSLEGARLAGEAELRRIPGIGPVLAKRILA